MHYLVTGATGFVGGHVVDRLLEQGATVRALVLPSEPSEPLRRRGVEVDVGDLTEGTDLAGLVDGVDVVIHCAGIVGLTGTPEAMRKVNLEGTVWLLAACNTTSLARFVFMSSSVIYGSASSPVTEDRSAQPVGPYAESKWAAEQAIWRYHAEHGLPAVVLRPAIIYGPGDRLTWPRLERALRRRVLPLPDGGKRILDLVYVSDVVEALLAAASRPEAVGHAYNITDGEIHSYRDILLAYEQASGRRPRILPIPSKALMGTLQRLFRMMQTLRVPGNWERQSGRLRGLNLDIHYAIDAARRDLAYVPRVGLQEGVRRTMAWYTDHQPAGSGT